MHSEAAAYVDKALRYALEYLQESGLDVIELGSRNVNGSPYEILRDALEPNAQLNYFGVDMVAGPGVDMVADASVAYVAEDGNWLTLGGQSAPLATNFYDLVICTEVFEHAAGWRGIVKNAYALMRPGGFFIGTAAAGKRTPHGAIDGRRLGEKEHSNSEYELKKDPDKEFYQNVHKSGLIGTLEEVGFVEWTVEENIPHGDIYWSAEK